MQHSLGDRRDAYAARAPPTPAYLRHIHIAILSAAELFHISVGSIESGRSSTRTQTAPASIARNRHFFEDPSISIRTSKAHELALVHISSETISNKELKKSTP
jgi:hypothetical protein